MDPARRVLSRPVVYELLGRLLFSAGVVLACWIGVRLLREAVDNQIAQQANYLLIPNTPVFGIPPATPLPTLTPTPTPTALPPPLPAIRLSIPAIKLNISIEEIFPTLHTNNRGQKVSVWDVPSFVVGHYSTSGNPGEGRNIVLTGHNNTLGEVFRDLNQLNPGDQVILFTEEKSLDYQVQQKYIIPYFGAEEEGNAILQSYAAPGDTEIITLISCWPYATNYHRIVIIAVPSSSGEENVQ